MSRPVEVTTVYMAGLKEYEAKRFPGDLHDTVSSPKSSIDGCAKQVQRDRESMAILADSKENIRSALGPSVKEGSREDNSSAEGVDGGQYHSSSATS